MGNVSKVVIGVTILVIAAVIGLFITAAWNDYAELNYRLQGPSEFYASGNNHLDISLYQGNSGNIGVIPTTQISVVNATITGVSMEDVAQYELPNFCQYNDTVANISKLTVVKGRSLSNWATIYVTPKNGVPSFSVSASVTLPTDWQHPKSTSMKNLPIELDYNQTGTNSYVLLQSLG
jgi:hypothetical protein